METAICDSHKAVGVYDRAYKWGTAIFKEMGIKLCHSRLSKLNEGPGFIIKRVFVLSQMTLVFLSYLHALKGVVSFAYIGGQQSYIECLK